jgi:hypothetical protein
MVVKPNQTLIVMMRSLSYRALALCALLFLIVGCAGIERFLKKFEPEEVFYKEVGQTYMTWRESYSRNDTLNANYYVFCAQTGKDGNKKDQVILSLDDDVLSSSIKKGIKKTQIPIKFSNDYLRIDSNEYCQNSPKVKFHEYALNLLKNDDFSFLYTESRSPQLFLIASYGAFWDYEVEAAPPAGLVTTGRSYYRVNRGLIAAVLEHDTIAYMNYYFHRDTAYVDDGEPLEYEWPQEIWDSLTVLTMQRYKDRLQ